MTAVEKIKIIRESAHQIKDLFVRKIPMWREDPKHFDKTRWGFVQGDGDGWYESQAVTLHFGAWAGTYGDSSCYKQIDLNGNVFREHFIKYLNANKEPIMMAVAASIEADAAKLKGEAEAELHEGLKELADL